jgi:iron complex outermembrane receptor protein
MEYFDELVKSGELDIFGDPIDGNAPRTRHIGIELQAAKKFDFQTSGKLTLSGNATYSYNRIIDYEYMAESIIKYPEYKYDVKFNGGDTSFVYPVQLSNNIIAGFPDFLAGIRIRYEYKNLNVSAIGKYVGEFRTDNFADMLKNDGRIISSLRKKGEYYEDNKNDAYFVLNADISYSLKKVLSFNNINFRMQINNLLNELYSSSGEGREFFPAAERNIFIGLELDL